MKGWHCTKPNEIVENEIIENFDKTVSSKVKITKSLVTLADVLRFTGVNRVEDVVPCSVGIGVISEPGNNLFDLEKGTRVYIDPENYCSTCYNCKHGEMLKCTDVQLSGEDTDGFLRDFACVESHRLFRLPSNVSDFDALFIKDISVALSIINSLNVEKGDHIAIIGATNLGIILAELLIYYQAVPILLDTDEENIEIAKKSGIYYTLSDDDKWIKEVTNITGGRMAKGVVYMTDSDMLARTAFNVASFNAPVIFSGTTNKNNSFSFLNALKKQLVIMFINSGYGNTASSINLIANKAFDFSHLKIETSSYKQADVLFANLAKKLEKEEKLNYVVVDLL